MLSIHFLSLQIDISWSKKEKSKEIIDRYVSAKEIEKRINEIKSKSYEYMRII